jgi:hypothetical protein
MTSWNLGNNPSPVTGFSNDSLNLSSLLVERFSVTEITVMGRPGDQRGNITLIESGELTEFWHPVIIHKALEINNPRPFDPVQGPTTDAAVARNGVFVSGDVTITEHLNFAPSVIRDTAGNLVTPSLTFTGDITGATLGPNSSDTQGLLTVTGTNMEDGTVTFEAGTSFLGPPRVFIQPITVNLQDDIDWRVTPISPGPNENGGFTITLTSVGAPANQYDFIYFVFGSL